MSYVIRLLARPQRQPHVGAPLPAAGDFLARWDFDFAGGKGAAWWTPNLSEAHRFESAKEALQTYVTQSRLLPLRPWDGQPNRPLTAYTIEVLTVEEAERGLRKQKAR